MNNDHTDLGFLFVTLFVLLVVDVWFSLPFQYRFILLFLSIVIVVAGCGLLWRYFSKSEQDRITKINAGLELPKGLREPSVDAVVLGPSSETESQIYLPDLIRSRHVHILGATGSGKTESVILNLIRQDVNRGLGAIIMDAKGDWSFIETLRECVPDDRLSIFDLGDELSQPYDPLLAGAPLESAQRLFSSMTWSEEYYKLKSFSVLQSIYTEYFSRFKSNPTISELTEVLKTAESYLNFFNEDKATGKLRASEFTEVAGLRDQLNSLSLGHLKTLLSPNVLQSKKPIDLNLAAEGHIIYFRLQSLLSPQAVSILGRLIINHLNYMAGTFHRKATTFKRVPVYLDEFASFACPEFADLISKARSAGMMLHFSHQSIGDLVEVSEGFLNRITDNSATKIVLRINDPDSAEFFARSFGTKISRKVTHRVTTGTDETAGATDVEIIGEGSLREGHTFRASPDLFKTLPTGRAAVLIAHGEETPHGASSVLTIQFPRLERKKQNV
jgi:hypothetical protein